MRASIALTGLATLAVLSSTAFLMRAQAPAAAPAMMAAPAANAPGLRVGVDAEHRDLVLEVGPVDLPANGGHRQLPAYHAALPVDGWLHGYRVEMVDADGRPVPRRTLHHVNVIVPGQRELFSPIMLRMAAAGQETAPVALPRMLGYRVRSGQELIVTVMMHNPTPTAYRGVKLRLHFGYTPGSAVLKPVSVFPFYMDVMPPASLHSWDLPPGRSRRSWEARPAVAGRILGVSGHLHQYGTALRLEDVTAGKVIWNGRPQVDGEGEVVGMPASYFVWQLGIPVRADHVYRITAEYDNPTGQTIPGGAMGALGGAIVPEGGARWPGVDPNNPELKLDWHLVHTGNQGGHMHMRMQGAAPPASGHDHGAMPGMSHGAAARPAAQADAMAGTGGMDHAHAHDHQSHR
ncbi:hypothetical protein [Longimicrobium sp.]|uniref:hypothetical protein n=1 Tax=Longimicrobium sp. TaxID=2029185 RepID=UPI002D1B7EBA|nr:hypothetical protein [Longimicrobium sp.]HSU15886.1 hypothetical protein [Longimicrobium sp.]